MNDELKAQLASDRRRAAAAIIHFGQGNFDGVNAVLQESAEADRVSPFIIGLLDLYNDLMPALHTPLGMGLLGDHLMALAQMEAPRE